MSGLPDLRIERKQIMLSSEQFEKVNELSVAESWTPEAFSFTSVHGHKELASWLLVINCQVAEKSNENVQYKNECIRKRKT